MMKNNFCRHVRALLLLAVAVLFTGTASAKTYIVCVGIADYPGERNDLYLCAKDARTIQWLFDKNGDAETTVLTDREATVSNICAAMRRLYAKAGKKDAVAIFYSGHGNAGSLECRDGELSYDELCRIFDESKARRRFAFINACFSGTLRRNHDLAALNKKEVMFFMSSRSGEYTLENSFMRNGIFTAYLQQGLRGSADTDRNRKITARELFEYVSQKVREKTDDRQHPVMWGKFDDDMVIMSW